MIEDNLCLSGGAEGSDLQWGMTAGSAGHSVIHWSFSGHRTRAPALEVVRLSDDQLSEADPHLSRAAQTLRRHFPPKSPFVRKLLQRNWYQVAHSGSLYAVATITHGLVDGGTGWAVQMFIDRHNGEACPAYVFCQRTLCWHRWDGAGGWAGIDRPPAPSGIWAGVGTRDLSPEGKAAIRDLMGWIRPEQSAA